MTTLSKKIQKTKKPTRNCLVLGSLFGNLEEIVNVFDSVFVVTADDVSLRRKNLIYRETIESVSILPDIDFIFIDRKYFSRIEELLQIWRRHRPLILTEGNEAPPKDIIKFLKNENYYVTWVDKKFCLLEFKAR